MEVHNPFVTTGVAAPSLLPVLLETSCETAPEGLSSRTKRKCVSVSEQIFHTVAHDTHCSQC